MKEYVVIQKIGEGSFSEVFKAKHGSDYVAIKIMKKLKNGSSSCTDMHLPIIICAPSVDPSTQTINGISAFESKEIIALKLFQSPNIVKLHHSFVDSQTLRDCIVTELMDSNLFEFLQSYPNGIGENLVKVLIWQALNGLQHVHHRGFFHRDIKPENMLVNIKTLTLKLADFGSCRQQTLFGEHLTEYISTRWYRAPECFGLSLKQYSKEMDIWSIGCVIFELLKGRPAFPGKNEAQQLKIMQDILGPLPANLFDPTQILPTTFGSLQRFSGPSKLDTLLQDFTSDCVDLIKSMFSYQPSQRISASSALSHRWFKSLNSPRVAIPSSAVEASDRWFPSRQKPPSHPKSALAFIAAT